MRSLLAWTSALVFFVGACGKVLPSSDEAPTITSHIPAIDETDVDPITTIQIVFSEPMLAPSINDRTILLSARQTPVSGAVTLAEDGVTATFVPAERLDLLGRYTVTATTGATDLAGNALAVDLSWSFEVRDGVWSSVTAPLETDVDDIYARVGCDDAGRCVAVWSAWNGTNTVMRSKRFVPPGTWERLPDVPTNDNTVSAVDLAVGPSGHAILMWAQHTTVGGSGRFDAYGNAFDSGVWTVPQPVETNDSTSVVNERDFAVRVGIDGGGNGLAIWQRETTSGTVGLWSNRYEPTTGWAPPVLLAERVARLSADLAMNRQGQAIATWSQDDGGGVFHVWAKRYEAGAWQPSQQVQDVGTARDEVRASIASDGTATVVWIEQFTGYLRSRLASPAGTWGPVRLVQADTADSELPSLATDGLGHTMAVWLRYDGVSRLDVVAARQDAATGTWGAQEPLFLGADSPGVALDPRGNGFAFGVAEPDENVWVRRYVNGAGWRPEQRISMFPTGGGACSSNSAPKVAITRHGDAIALWCEMDPAGEAVIRAARFE
jgi:hypothetical protein